MICLNNLAYAILLKLSAQNFALIYLKLTEMQIAQYFNKK